MRVLRQIGEWFRRRGSGRRCRPALRGYQRRLLVEPLEIRRVFAAGFAEFIDPNPAPGNQFGASVVPLATGNVVITSPFDDAGGEDAGAVYLFNGRTGELISTLRGSQANDHVGSAGVMPLSNGNFVVFSPDWDHAAVVDASAVTWGSGINGVHGSVSKSNSLVGSKTNDMLGLPAKVPFNASRGIIALSNGNYVIASPKWDNGEAVDAGAVTFGDGTTGTSGEVSEANSLIGTIAGDEVGNYGIVPLSNGNYVVSSPDWNSDLGAATFGSGTTGISGPINSSNSLVGTLVGDRVSSNDVVALANGNYVVCSANWQNGSNPKAGAVTFADGDIGAFGNVTATNSLVGTQTNDRVGNGGAVALPSGNYVVRSDGWKNGQEIGAGAATFGSGLHGIVGEITPENSLVGLSNDFVGRRGIVVLANGNYVVLSYGDTGAVTFGNGLTGISGIISATNSLVGSSPLDDVGFVIPLKNGDYLVGSPDWDNGDIANVGAVTFGDGNNGVSGIVSAANSLIGTTANDHVGRGRITELTNGNYLIGSVFWDNGGLPDVGAITFVDGVKGLTGIVGPENSLVGSRANDQVGRHIALSNGAYVAGNLFWDSTEATDAGAVTIGDGMTGTVGLVDDANGFVGSTEGDQVGGVGGNLGIIALPNGNFLVQSPGWDHGSTVDAGAVTLGSTSAMFQVHVSEANSLIGSMQNDRVGGDSIAVFSNSNYLVISKEWDNGEMPDAGAVTFGNGITGATGFISSLNSAIGETANTNLQSIVVDDVNQHFYASFLNEGGGRVRVGSQIDGFSRPWHLAVKPEDVNNDGHIVADDVLKIINYINAGHASEVAEDAAVGQPYGFLDVTGDGNIVAEDVIKIINWINARPAGDEEGEAASLATSPPPAAASTTNHYDDALLLLLSSDITPSKKRSQ